MDFSRLVPGPWATMFLADYGAEVIKVEEPQRGDYSRWSYPRYRQESVYFATANRNKRSIRLDLSTDTGLEVAMRLAERSDALVESFRPGVADRLGLGYEKLSGVNPKLIYVSVTGFGQTGPYRGHAGHDLNISGIAGFLNPTASDDPPRNSGLQMADFAGASMAVIAVLLALRDRDLTGRGQYLDVAMLDSLISWSTITATSALARLAGFSGEPLLQAFGGNPRYSIYQAKDGRFLSVSLLERSFWKKFCEAVDRMELVNPHERESERLSDHGEFGRRYREELETIFKERFRDDWVDFLLGQGIPCFAVNTPDEAFLDRQLAAREMLLWVDHPTEGRIPQLGFPIKSSEMKPTLKSPPPSYGQHTAEILAELGYSIDEIRTIEKESYGG